VEEIVSAIGSNIEDPALSVPIPGYRGTACHPASAKTGNRLCATKRKCLLLSNVYLFLLPMLVR
jgi:hypothetical protein